MRKMFAIRGVGTDKWAVSFSDNKANLGLFENARFYNKIGTARGLASKSFKKNGVPLEVVEFDLTEVKPAKAPSWDELKKYVDEEIAKVKPKYPNYQPCPPADSEDKLPWKRVNPPYKRHHEIWCGIPPKEDNPIMINTPENPSLMVACST